MLIAAWETVAPLLQRESRECQTGSCHSRTAPARALGLVFVKPGESPPSLPHHPRVQAVCAAKGCPGRRGLSWQPHLVAQPRCVPTEIQTLRAQARTCTGHESLRVSALAISIPRGAQAQVKLSGFLYSGHSQLSSCEPGNVKSAAQVV